MADRREAPAENPQEIDMSPEAVSARLDELAQLYELGIYLTQAQPPADSESHESGERRVE